MGVLFCSLMPWISQWDQKKTGISWRVSTLLLMCIVLIAVRCSGGNMRGHMRHHRSTKKGSSFLKSQKLLGTTGSILWSYLMHWFLCWCKFIDSSWCYLVYKVLVDLVIVSWPVPRVYSIFLCKLWTQLDIIISWILTICVNEIVVLKLSHSCPEHALDYFGIVVLSFGSMEIK